jgi:hypothetical protein
VEESTAEMALGVCLPVGKCPISDAVDIGSGLSASGSVSSTLHHGQIQIETQPWRYVELAATQVNLYGGPQHVAWKLGLHFFDDKSQWMDKQAFNEKIGTAST